MIGYHKSEKAEKPLEYNSSTMVRARYRRILLFFLNTLFKLIWWELIVPRLGLRKLTQRTRPIRLRKISGNFRTLAVRMGGVMIKVGQFLSSRVDILPPEITDELKGLQDEVPAEDFSDIRRVIESELNASLEEIFLLFDPQPLAAASLGQVHRAQIAPVSSDTLSLNNVVIKVQRPNIENIIATDLAALKTVGRWLQLYKPIRRRVNIPLLLDEFSRILYEEIDYLAEADNAERFASDFKGDRHVRVPKVMHRLTTKRVLTLEDVWAIKITDYETILAAGIPLSQVAARLVNVYLVQIFDNGFFHADPHPGNLFVHPLSTTQNDEGETSTEWELTFVDFGMVGRIPSHLRDGLRELLIGIGTRDVKRVVHAYEQLGVLLPGADLKLIEEAEKKLFERFWGKSMRELASIDFKEMHQFAIEFRELIYKMPFQMPQNLILMGRCVGILAGMCMGLDAEFNLWDHLVPFAEKLLAQESEKFLEQWLDEVEKLVKALLTLPRRLDLMLTRIEQGEVEVIIHAPELEQGVRDLNRKFVKIPGAITFAALLLGGIQAYLQGETTLSIVLFVAAGINLFWLMFKG